MPAQKLRSLLTLLVPALLLWPSSGHGPGNAQDGAASASHTSEAQPTLRVRYLEIVTPEVDTTCSMLEAQHGVRFSPATAELGAARTAHLEAGGRIGVRAPMHDQEEPVVRPYFLVEDLEAALEEAREAGALVAMTATEIPDRGRFAIYFLGGVQYGLWEL